jgi:hypothetical protein
MVIDVTRERIVHFLSGVAMAAALGGCVEWVPPFGPYAAEWRFVGDPTPR